MRTETEGAESLDPITAVQQAQRELPCRVDMDVLDAPVKGWYESHSSRDRVPADGHPMRHSDGWGICVDWQREEHDYREWWMAGTVRPPETLEERRAIARTMARRWDRELHDALLPAPSDYRDRDKVVAKREKHADLRTELIDAGLLDR